jgi:hypothetical protein
VNLVFLSIFIQEMTFMRNGKLRKLFPLTILALGFLAVGSYKQVKQANSQDCINDEKCCQKKVQSDFILLETISKHLFSMISSH